MSLSLDVITLAVPQVGAARSFYARAFTLESSGDDHSAPLNLHGTGRLAIRQFDALARDVGANPTTSGFRGYVLSSVVSQPAEVKALLEAATTNGATVVKPAKRQLFGEFTAVHQAPDGAVWKLAADSRKNIGPIPDPPNLLETAVYLGVTSPKVSRTFYEKLGMSVDHDYGDKFIDFIVPKGSARLGLLPRGGLAKDAGVDPHGDGFSGLVLSHSAGSRDEVDALLAVASSSGGRVIAAATRTDQGHCEGRFSDPDGYHWTITAPG